MNGSDVLAAGLTLGAILATLGISYAVTFGVLGLINFALGEAFMLGCFFFLGMQGLIGASSVATLISLVAAVAGAALLGCGEYVVAFHPLLRRRGVPPILLLLSSLGVSFVLQNTVLVFVDSGNVPFPGPDVLVGGGWGIFSATQILVLGLTAAGSAGGLWFVAATRVGRAMRAVRDDRDLAEIVGVSPFRIGLAAFALSHALAALAGVAMGFYSGATRFDAGFIPGLKGFSAALLGGIGDPLGAFLGGLVLGISESFVASYISSQYKDLLAFLILVVVLLFRPRGLLGRGRA